MTALLAAEGLKVARAGRTVLHEMRLSAHCGEFIGVIGPNGAGKSTLLRALAGLERPAMRAILLDGAPISALSPLALARRRAYLPQQREIAWSMTVTAVAALGRFAYGSPSRLGPADRAAVERALVATGLADLCERNAHELSGGETARLHLARALAAETPILLADEPTAALDPRHQLEIMEILKAKSAGGGLIVAALHDLDLARRYCTRLLVMDAGRILADAEPEEALDAARLDGVFGVVAEARGYRLSP